MLQILLSGRGRLITHTIGWVLAGLVLFYLISGVRPVQEALGRTALNLFLPMVLFYVNGRVLINRFFEQGKYRVWLLTSLGLWLGISVLRTRMEMSIFGSSLFAEATDQPEAWRRIFLAILLIYLLLMVFSGLYQLLENRRELETRHTEAQLNYLKAQINPHFLFNTLNNLYAAATLQHPRTPDMVLRLSDLLRYVTYEAQARQVPLTQEIAQIRAYLELFQLQAEHALPIWLEVTGDAERHVIEPLLLLPLVENALKHSDLHTRPQAARVHILVDAQEAGLRVRVENTFLEADQQKDEMGGVGLENIRQRLALRYAGRYRFSVGTVGEVFTAELWLETR